MPSRDIDPASLVHGFVNQAGGLTPEAIQFLEQMRKAVNRAASALRLGSDDSEPDLRPLGVGQSWVTFSASDRKANTQYTNNTGRTIAVVAHTIETVSSSYAHTETSAYVDGTLRYRNIGYGIAGTARSGVSFLVPSGSTYEVRCHTSDDVERWSELR